MGRNPNKSTRQEWGPLIAYLRYQKIDVAMLKFGQMVHF